MSYNEEQFQKDASTAAQPLIKFLKDYGHAHMKVIVSQSDAEVVEGVVSVTDEEVTETEGGG